MARKPSLPRSPDAIRKHMTPRPVTIAANRTLAEAHALMRERRIRHLPVVAGDSLVGILSLRDLHLLETLRDVDPSQVTVDEAMTPNPYAVVPEAPLQSVVDTMARNKWGSAIVVKKGRVVGLFTATDGMRLLAKLLPHAGRPSPKARPARRSS
jgi:acetoin utilization protein AcuB